MAERALSELTVIEYSSGVSGATCAKAFADLGANVIKVEPPEGDSTRRTGPFPGHVPNPEASGQFIYLNTNKRGIVLDVESAQGYETLCRLLVSADLFVTDLQPQRAVALRLDYQTLLGLSDTLVATYVTPFGSSGPYKDRQGSDLIAWHMGGMGWETPAFAVTDLEKEPPIRGGGYHAEYLAGWTAASASAVALAYKDTYGVGQMVDVSAMEAVANHIRGNFATYSYDISRLPETRLKASFPWTWPCKDGYVSASFLFDHWWVRLKDLMGRPEWAENSDYDGLLGRRENMQVIEDGVIEWLSNYTRRELYKTLTDAGIPCYPVLSMEEVISTPQYVERGFFVEQDHPVAGLVKHPGAPIALGRTPWSLERPAPTLGQHDNEVLAELASAKVGSTKDRQSRTSSAGSGDIKNRPLQGVRVLDFGWILSVPHCGAWLGTMGADVIRIESQARLELGRQALLGAADGIQGFNRSSGWNGLNYSKRDVTLNLTQPEAIELVKELVAISDVVTENFATGVLERLGLGYETLRKIKPDIIMLSGSTLGVTGPERQASGFGPNVVSYAGQPFVSGYEGGPPVNMGGNWPDYLVGTMMMFSILSALRHRQKEGEGQYIEASMAEVVACMIPEAYLEYTMNGRHVERRGNHDLNMSPHNVYRCIGDDQWVAVAVRNDGEWSAFCRATGNPEWATDSRFVTLEARKQNEADLDALIGEWTKHHSPRQVTDLLQSAGVAAGPVMNVIDLMGDPHFKERGYVVEMDHPEVGVRTVAGIPAKFSAMPKLAYSPAPLLGQHNQQIFGEVLGVDQGRIEELTSAQVIY